MGAVQNIPVPAHVFVRQVPAHLDIKPRILEAIQAMGEFSYRSVQNSLSNTDWHLNANIIRPYFDIVRPNIAEHVEALRADRGYDTVSVGGVWFQQYKHGDFHDWHMHGDCTFSSVYYVDLAGGTPKTSFLYNGVEFDIEVSEGDIITFPSYLMHKSKVNTSKNIKTVIAFNSNVNVGM